MRRAGRFSQFGVIAAAVLLLALSVSVGCSTKARLIGEAAKIKETADATREKQKDVLERGGHICGLKELALADAHRAFLLYEIEEGDYPMVLHHLEQGKAQVALALRKATACEPPDRDRDGILDSVDACPDDPEDKDGFQDEDGCPEVDNDQDGLVDTEDKCPNDAEDKDGFQDEDGCPDPDNDNDGIPDAQDKCPMEPEDKDGFMDDDGCPEPDNDLDGINDDKDKCPNEAETYNGIDDEDGCPDENKYSLIEVTQTSIQLKQTVFFENNKAAIMPKSYPLLNEVAQALKDFPTMTVEIGGHTDSNGSDAHNLKLSQARCDSIKKYLVQQGIADTRLKPVGYGEGKPIDTNKTAAGRARNRRVEINILSR